ncbi:dihydrodipicolinate synthetase family protein [Annulohypoxylon maeteangense]|uniref:dihydrodipicolinate synthetase family protein n=1 Tax=Annulohypoxylon maeteangense TaxID=1927788 RepID=UPI00200898E9|nr:dihydrodipicolinate synthetase family protein [Annulohypoxylon maeteangense]KAI0889631.1 dihydrodipicolinate synthetase family protein [Annulohypoxylon maeteangense]
MTESLGQSRPLPDGVYVPTVAFFKENDDIDLEATQRHAVHLAEAGVAGLVVHGSNGEAVHLSRDERSLVIKTTRAALDQADHHLMPLIAGCGAQSTRETIQLCQDAANAGANYVIVLPPAYYGGLLNTSKIVQHFCDVADSSPIPVMIYNYPGACSGLDLSSDAILQISKHPNVAGVKLTCGNTGKLARIVDGAKPDFFVAGGSADFILQGLVVGGNGTIAGTANLVPRACVRICELYHAGELKEARRLQAIVAKADWIAIQTGFAGVKAALQHFEGYGGEPRKPCGLPSSEHMDMITNGFADVIALEQSLV